jgi:hypothetical protein
MPLTSPILDDLDYATVQEMLRERIPLVAPEWTDHNDSDPGIAMIQLFAHLAEHVGYRLNRVPEKSYVEYLRLVGVKLAPSVAAQTRCALTLTKPANAQALAVRAYTQVKATSGGPPPTFETDTALDVLPAQIAALITTRGGLLDINASGETGPIAAGIDAETYLEQRFSIAWNGKAPKLKDMATDPARLFMAATETAHTTLYVGLAFNRSPAAGFRGARASLHLQLDQDEEPETDVSVQSGAAPLSIVNAFPDGAMVVEYAYYRPPDPGDATGAWMPLSMIADETEGWTRSGTMRFDVPDRIGAIPDGSWANVEPGMAHPLVGALKTPVADTPAQVPISGWIRVRFSIPPQMAIRSLNFNTVAASHLSTVVGERLGRGTGLPGQALRFINQNIAAETADIVSVDESRDDAVIQWRRVEDFDAVGATETVYALDAEAGLVMFGDGMRGRPPVQTERIIARAYRHGGGASGDLGTGMVSLPSGLPSALNGAFNIIPARGGRDAETLEAAKLRAPRAFRMRERAVTGADFADAARQAPGVKVARAQVIGRRRPYPEGHLIDGLDAPGVNFSQDAPGAVTVVVVPDAVGAYPMPTTSELVAVAAHLDRVRLVTTEVFVTTPQYVRFFDFNVTVRAAPGYTATQLREAISDHLRRHLHVLTGGADGTGFAFGSGIHHADLMAAVMSVDGVARVEELTCIVDGRTPDSAPRILEWRLDRRLAQRLTNCSDTEDDTDQIVLLPDEVPFVDAETLNVRVVGAP